jgi:replication factor A2
MYDAAQFGGGRGGAAGGSAAPGGNSPGNKNPQQKSSRAPIPLRPVTVRQLLEAQRVGDGALVVSQAEIGSVTIAGRVIHSQGADGANTGTARSHTYQITDGTGVITVRHWLDASSTEASEPEASGSMVVATGNVKVYQDKPQLTGSVRVLHDANEFTYHLLDSIQVHLRMTQGDKQIPGSKNKSDGPAAAAAAPGMSAAPATGMPAAAGGDASLDAALHRVMMSVGDRGVGISAEDAHTRLRQVMPNVSAAEVKAKLDELSGSGFYFPTSNGKYSY